MATERPQAEDRRGQCRDVPEAVDRHVSTSRQFVHEGPNLRHARCVDEIISTHSFRQHERFIVHVDGNDTSAQRSAEGDCRQTDATAPVHAQHLAALEASSFDDAAIGRRDATPDQRGNVIGNLVRNHHGIDVGERDRGEAGKGLTSGSATVCTVIGPPKRS